MNHADLPRVAIVSNNPIRRDQANGILVGSLFRDWPRDKLSQIYFPVAVRHLPDLSVCQEYRLIGVSGRTQRIAGSRHPTGAENIAQRPARESGRFARQLTDAVKRRQHWFGMFRSGLEHWYVHSHLGRVLESQLRELRPDVVYALLGNYSLTRLTYLACQRLDLPLYLHITDDFITSIYRNVPFSKQLGAASDHWIRLAVDYSSGRAGISPVMAEQFESRYGRPWEWYTTLTTADDYQPAPPPPCDRLRFVFAGNLGVQRWQSLARLAQALLALRREQGVASVLEVYAPPDHLAEYGARIAVPGITELKGWVSMEQLPQVFHAADVLVHVESFDEAMVAITRLSFSTKLSQYMMAGRCILAIGPAELGSLKMVTRVGAGVSISASDAAEFQRQLATFVSARDNLPRYGQQGRRWAMQWVERGEGQRRFRDSMMRLVRRARAAA